MGDDFAVVGVCRGRFRHGIWLKKSLLKPAPDTGYDEKWLQQLLFAKPDLIPLAVITPGTLGYVPICPERSIPQVGGTVYLDIFSVSAEGRLVLIECKLWRNPQVRREVIAQILEYASMLRHCSYADLTARLKAALGWSGPNPLFEHVRKAFPELQEAPFVDGVARSLLLGDFALIIAGAASAPMYMPSPRTSTKAAALFRDSLLSSFSFGRESSVRPLSFPVFL